MHYGVVKLSMLLNILQELRRSLVCAARLWITLTSYVITELFNESTYLFWKQKKMSPSFTVLIVK